MTRILVLGNAGVDLSLTLPRLPLAGETLVAAQAGRAPGGKGLNQAVVAARAGAQTIFAAPLGDDADAVFIINALNAEPFASLQPIRLSEPTDLSFLMVAPDGENSIVTIGGCASALTVGAAVRFGATARPGDLFLLQGNLTAAASRAAASAATAQGARFMLNAAPLLWSPVELLPFADVVVVNEVEAHDMTGQRAEAAAGALHALGATLAIVTLGAGGCIAADPTGSCHYPAPAVNAIDSSGAGDAFCGVLAAMIATGRSVATAIAAAQAAAACSVTRRGAFAALPSAAELATIVSEQCRD